MPRSSSPFFVAAEKTCSFGFYFFAPTFYLVFSSHKETQSGHIKLGQSVPLIVLCITWEKHRPRSEKNGERFLSVSRRKERTKKRYIISKNITETRTRKCREFKLVFKNLCQIFFWKVVFVCGVERLFCWENFKFLLSAFSKGKTLCQILSRKKYHSSVVLAP